MASPGPAEPPPPVGYNAWTSVTYGGGLFVAVAWNYPGRGNEKWVMTSPDGITWTSRKAAASKSGWSSVTYGGGLFVVVGGNRVMTSPDGITWTSRKAAANTDWSSVTYGGGLFVAVAWNYPGRGNKKRVMTSPDGITWTIRKSAASNNWDSVTYAGGLFVAVGSGAVMTSGTFTPSSVIGTRAARSAAVTSSTTTAPGPGSPRSAAAQ